VALLYSVVRIPTRTEHGERLAARAAECVRAVRAEGRQPVRVMLHPEDTVTLAAAVRPSRCGGCGLAVDVDGYAVTVFADRAVEPGKLHVGALAMPWGIA
jgi:hypothetical protein